MTDTGHGTCVGRLLVLDFLLIAHHRLHGTVDNKVLHGSNRKSEELKDVVE